MFRFKASFSTETASGLKIGQCILDTVGAGASRAVALFGPSVRRARHIHAKPRRRTISTREAYEKKLEAQLDEWKAQTAELKAKAAKAEADARIEYEKTIEALEQQQNAAQAKLDELRRSGEDAWLDLKVGIEAAWNRLGETLKTAASRFN